MIFEIAIGDTLRTVSIVRKGGMLHVDLDGRTHLVDARRVSASIVSMLVQLDGASTPSRSIDAAFASRPEAGDYDVHLDGRTIPVRIRPAGSLGRHNREGSGAQATGPQHVASPMSGKVVRVLVKPGDNVKGHQGLVVVEARKMEIELRAARDGRVREVAVAEGQSVDAGAVLMVVE